MKKAVTYVKKKYTALKTTVKYYAKKAVTYTKKVYHVAKKVYHTAKKIANTPIVKKILNHPVVKTITKTASNAWNGLKNLLKRGK